MDLAPLTDADDRLVDHAVAAAEAAFSPDGAGRFDGPAHIVSAAVEASDGDVYTAASLPASVGRASTCAEPGALGSAVADGAHSFERVVAVEHPRGVDESFRVVPPCGVCRELLADYGDDIRVVVRTEAGDVGVARAADLLPVRTW
ncbi:hypothetical protein [Halobacterium wangiae]|uniref:hypothetical protein n=1 Tax=Halobacterium wangiae TaxID=2902623 RepID=UPI001E4D2743|nr:hypothetical protein [Halobacterium wangiae]